MKGYVRLVLFLQSKLSTHEKLEIIVFSQPDVGKPHDV